MTVPTAVAIGIPPGRRIYHNRKMFSISPAARYPQWITT
jgi:hypothetical protein